jgi:hypothetical protein
MSKSRSELRWHLSRGDEPSCLITERELQQLAELGQLKETDLLWKPGLVGWQRADLIPGVLTPPLLPAQKMERIGRALFAGATRHINSATAATLAWTKRVAGTLQVMRARSAKFYKMQFDSLDANARRVAETLHQTIARTKSLRWIDQPGSTIAILLGLTLIFGTLNFAMQGFAVEAEESSLIRRGEAISCPQPKRDSEINHSANNADIFAGFALLTDSIAISETDLNPIEPMPLPTRKPAKASVGKTDMRAARESRPMRFGTLGFAYDPQN